MVTWWFVSLFLLFKLWYHSCRLGRWNLYKNGIEHELLTRLVFFLHRESRDIPVMLVWEDTGAAVQVGGEFGKADKYLSSKQGTEAAPLILQQLTLVKNIWWQGGRFNLIKRTASYRFKKQCFVNSSKCFSAIFPRCILFWLLLCKKEDRGLTKGRNLMIDGEKLASE